jgi:hypothetical protein
MVRVQHGESFMTIFRTKEGSNISLKKFGEKLNLGFLKSLKNPWFWVSFLLILYVVWSLFFMSGAVFKSYNDKGFDADANRNWDEGFMWFQKSANQGNAVGEFRLGLAYATRLGVNENDVEALKWFRKSADQGFFEAEDELGDCYKSGYLVKKNINQAKYWYGLAAAKGYWRAQDSLKELK